MFFSTTKTLGNPFEPVRSEPVPNPIGARNGCTDLSTKRRFCPSVMIIKARRPYFHDSAEFARVSRRMIREGTVRGSMIRWWHFFCFGIRKFGENM